MLVYNWFRLKILPSGPKSNGLWRNGYQACLYALLKPVSKLYIKPKAEKRKFTVFLGDFRETRTPFIYNVCSVQLLRRFAGTAISSLQILVFLFSL